MWMNGMYNWECCKCGAIQAMTLECEKIYRQTNGGFYCVHGHPQYFPVGKTEAQKLREQLEEERRARQRAEQNAAYFSHKAEHERNRANGYKGHATRMTKRARLCAQESEGASE